MSLRSRLDARRSFRDKTRRRNPTLDHPCARLLKIGNRVRDAAKPAVVGATPLKQKPWPSAGVTWRVDNPAVPRIVTAAASGSGTDALGECRTVLSGHAAGHPVSMPGDRMYVRFFSLLTLGGALCDCRIVRQSHRGFSV